MVQLTLFLLVYGPNDLLALKYIGEEGETVRKL